MTELSVMFQNAVEVSGSDLRHAFAGPLGEGVEGYEDLRVKPGAATTTVDVLAGVGYVRGDGLTDQGLYRVRNDATKNSSNFSAGGMAAPHATKPRLDMICARVYDTDVDGSGSRKWVLFVVAGTATTGATLDNREGAAALPESTMLLADVLVPAGAAAVLESSAIRDRRPFCNVIVPPLLTDVDMVPLTPLPAGLHGSNLSWSPTYDLQQAAIPCFLPRRIVGATRIRWKFFQTATPLTGSYVLALFDASGRKVVDTGSVALGGGGLSYQVRSEAIAATTLEAGIYYLLAGLDTTGGSELKFPGTAVMVDPSNVGPVAPNLVVRSATGGVTVPATLLGMTDLNGLTATVAGLAIPDVYLSVG